MDEIKILDNIILTTEQSEKLKKILDKYKNSYPDYNKIGEKQHYFNKENELISQFQFEDYYIGDDNLGYLVSKDNKIKLDDNYIKFIFERLNGLQICICEKEYYLQNNKEINTCEEEKYLDFFKKELKKIEDLINEYKKYPVIQSNKEKKIEFVKKICETINWGFEDINTSCEKIFNSIDLHLKTFQYNKQRTLGSEPTGIYETYYLCNKFFNGANVGKFYSSCHRTVEWTIILNKYATLSAYYKKAQFMRFLLIDGLIMPYRKFPQIKPENIKGTMIGNLNFGPYIFKIYLNNDNFELYDDKNFKILPPLLRSAKTVTYSEFRDLLCYLNLPVFRSTVNRNILFFPNYDLHQRLLEIQGLPRNYNIYTGRNIDWKWFNEGETVAKEAIAYFCQEYEECPGYGIKPVEYVWYDIKYPDTHNIKKFIFLVVPFEELEHYTGSDIYKRDGKYYICNKDEVPEHMMPQLIYQENLEHVNYIWYEDIILIKVKKNEYQDKETVLISGANYICNKYPDETQIDNIKKILQSKKTYHEKYLKYKIKYLNLKKLLQKVEKHL